MSIHNRNKRKKLNRYRIRDQHKIYVSDIFNISISNKSQMLNPNFGDTVFFAPDDGELQKITVIDNFDDFEWFKNIISAFYNAPKKRLFPDY